MTNVCITEPEAVKGDETFVSVAVLSLQICKHPKTFIIILDFARKFFHVVKENECSRLSLSAALLSLLIIRRQGNNYLSNIVGYDCK